MTVGALIVRLHRMHPHAPPARRAHGALDVGVHRACRRRRARHVGPSGRARRSALAIVVHRDPPYDLDRREIKARERHCDCDGGGFFMARATKTRMFASTASEIPSAVDQPSNVCWRAVVQ